ncbi:MAG: hypothetical protein PHN57_05360 [Candidatus Omnitrophica bacterium]|nr:hypothetical protein [Candidatus Omnitrophota bacterium]
MIPGILRKKNALTLIELLVSLCIIGFLIIAMANIDIFSRHHVMSSDKKTKVQNSLAYSLEHMTKEVSRTIGNEFISGADSVANTGTIAGAPALRVFVDFNNNGVSDAGDGWIAYRLQGNLLQFCSFCPTAACNTCLSWTTISNRIVSFVPSKPATLFLSKDSLDVSITACYDPAQTIFPCGTSDNPREVMQSTLRMPLVSVN